VDGKTAVKACDKLTPKLLAQLSKVCGKNHGTPIVLTMHTLKPSTSPETLIETLMTLSILIGRFPAILSSTKLNPPPLTVIAPLLSHARPAVRRRAIATLAQFVPISSPSLFSELLHKEIIPAVVSSTGVEKQQTMVQLIAAVARQSPGPISPALQEIIPGALKAIEKDNDDLRESCLQTLEVLVLRCPTEVTQFLSQIIETANRFIKYDPVRPLSNFDEATFDLFLPRIMLPTRMMKTRRWLIWMMKMMQSWMSKLLFAY
jgi:cullin-associated NEDD8-dissociated protein 1